MLFNSKRFLGPTDWPYFALSVISEYKGKVVAALTYTLIQRVDACLF